MKLHVDRIPKVYIFLRTSFVVEDGLDLVIEKGQIQEGVFLQGRGPGGGGGGYGTKAGEGGYEVGSGGGR